MASNKKKNASPGPTRKDSPLKDGVTYQLNESGTKVVGIAAGNRDTAASFKAAGPILSQSEVKAIAKAKGISQEEAMSRGLDKGLALGSKVVKNYNTPGALGVSVYSGTPNNLNPLKGLSIPKGTAYYGSSSQTAPGGNMPDGQRWSSTTTYNPIVLPRNTGKGTGAGTGSGSNAGNGSGNGNGNDPYQDLRDQIDAAKQQILDLQNQQVAPYPDISQLLADQQASAAAQQQSFAAQAAQQQKALQDLMIQQQQAYQMQMADARAQQERMAAQAAEAQRQAMAVANAYVPGLEPSASAPVLGDSRNRTRTSAANTLSNLSILTGMGISGGVTATPAAPLAGLQIA